MSQYIRKNKWSLAGTLLPVFFLFVLGVLSIGAFPGWIQPVYSLPGDLCSSASCDTTDPTERALLEACDVCRGEFCVFNGGGGAGQGGSAFQCAIFNGTVNNFNPAATPNPACPLDDPTQPGCWTSCTEFFDINLQNQNCELPICAPNDSFCDGISGGDTSHECREAVCLPVSTPDPLNPSGCDYDLDPGVNTDCRNCIPVGLATLENCGNGICEPDEGEGCVTCSIDCRIPGYDIACETDQAQLDALCLDPQGIVFPGPPYPTTPQDPGGLCEDGDLCTDNICGAAGTPDVGSCVVTDKVCSINAADFCCPADCAPPTDGTCGPNDNGCDIDCYVPEQCIIPTPTPVVFTGCLEGSGVFGSKKSGPGCGGFSCTLNPMASGMADLGVVLSLAGILGFGAFKGSRKRRG